MTPDQEAGEAQTLVPPRPNLGPEPWPEGTGWPGLAGWAGAGLALVFALAIWKRRRRRSRKGTPEPPGPIDLPGGLDPTPRQRLIASSEVVRGALIGAFGPAWASKTTEEIAEEPGLAGRFDPPEVERLLAFLRLADRVKFAEAEPGTADDWDDWAGAFISSMGAGTTSRINGR